MERERLEAAQNAAAFDRQIKPLPSPARKVPRAGTFTTPSASPAPRADSTLASPGGASSEGFNFTPLQIGQEAPASPVAAWIA
jgi:hypothetical protein